MYGPKSGNGIFHFCIFPDFFKDIYHFLSPLHTAKCNIWVNTPLKYKGVWKNKNSPKYCIGWCAGTHNQNIPWIKWIDSVGGWLKWAPQKNLTQDYVFTVLFGHNLDPMNHWNHINNFFEHSWVCALKWTNDCAPKHMPGSNLSLQEYDVR